MSERPKPPFPLSVVRKLHRAHVPVPRDERPPAIADKVQPHKRTPNQGGALAPVLRLDAVANPAPLHESEPALTKVRAQIAELVRGLEERKRR